MSMILAVGDPLAEILAELLLIVPVSNTTDPIPVLLGDRPITEELAVIATPTSEWNVSVRLPPAMAAPNVPNPVSVPSSSF